MGDPESIQLKNLLLRQAVMPHQFRTNLQQVQRLRVRIPEALRYLASGSKGFGSLNTSAMTASHAALFAGVAYMR